MLALQACFFVHSADAHYLWVTVDGELVNIYFEESPAAGDGYYLGSYPITTWVRTLKNSDPRELTIAEKQQGEDKKWLSGKIPFARPRSIESYGKFGVYTYDTTDVLLYYYARFIDVETHKELHDLASADHMDLDLIPTYDGNDLEVKVIWKGEPVSESIIHIRNSNGVKTELKTDQSGIVRLKIEDADQYSFRTTVTLDQAGREGVRKYSSIRHSVTLIIPFPLTQ